MSIIEETQTEYGYKKTIEYTEKTAEEMFEELGYAKTNDSYTLVIYKNHDGTEIMFGKFERDVVKREDNEYSYISIAELKAINKKCEELGWI